MNRKQRRAEWAAKPHGATWKGQPNLSEEGSNRAAYRAGRMGQRTRPVIRSKGLHIMSKVVLDRLADLRKASDYDQYALTPKELLDAETIKVSLQQEITQLLTPKQDVTYRGFQSSINTKAKVKA